MLIRRAVFESMGRFDEAHRIVNNDLDFCLRCHSTGRRVIYTPYARLVHHEMASRSSADDVYDEVHFKRRWETCYAAGDPFYSRALALDADDFSGDAEPIEVVFGGHPLLSKKRVLSILAMKIDHIGDFITALPALRRIRQHFPAARLCLMAASGSTQLAALEPCVDEIIEFNFFHARSSLGKVQLTADDLAALKRRLAPYRFDLAIDLRKHPDSRDLLLESGGRVLAGFDYKGQFPWLDIAVEWDGDTPLVPKRQHVSDDLLRLVDAVGTSCDPERPAIGTDQQPHRVDTPLDVLSDNLFAKPVVCIHPASGNPVRQWPEAHFAELVGMILREFDVNVCLIGGFDEELAIRRIWHMNDSHPAIHPLAGILQLRDLPHLLSRCALFVGNNSGPQHIAAGLSVPTIGVHSGVVDAIEWAPVGAASLAIRRNMSCSPCYLALPEYCPRDLACVKTLWPRAVFELCRQLLAIRHRRP
jgi:ADP-heptose:LPS heptosyltransferase